MIDERRRHVGRAPRRQRLGSFDSWMLQRANDRSRRAPVALEAVSRDEAAAASILAGLQLHYVECLLSGRLDVWASAGHAAINLLAEPQTRVHRRNELGAAA